MGIYIPGMEMPVCHFKTSESYNVHGFWVVYPDGKSKLHIMVGSDHWVCDAIPVPNHGRLIDGDSKTFPTFHRKELNDYMKGWNACLRSVQQQPTIIPADLLVMHYPQVPGITPTVIAEEGE